MNICSLFGGGGGDGEGDSRITLPAMQALLPKAKVLSTLQPEAYIFRDVLKPISAQRLWGEDLQHASPRRTHLSRSSFLRSPYFSGLRFIYFSVYRFQEQRGPRSGVRTEVAVCISFLLCDQNIGKSQHGSCICSLDRVAFLLPPTGRRKTDPAQIRKRALTQASSIAGTTPFPDLVFHADTSRIQ